MAIRGGDFTSHMDGYKDGDGGDDVRLTIRSEGSSTGLFADDRETIHRMYLLSKPEHPLLILSAFTLAITSAVQLCIPMTTGKIIDAALEERVDGQSSRIFTLLSGLFVIMSFASYLTYQRNVWQAAAGHHFTARIRQSLYVGILSQDAAYFDSNAQGDILSRLASDAELVQQAITQQALQLLRNTFMGVGAGSLLLYTSWSLALVSMTVLPPIMMIARWIGRSMKTQHKKVRELHGHATSLAEQTLTGMPTVQQFCAEGYEARRYGKAIQEAHSTAISTAKLQAQSSGFIQLLSNGSMLCVLGYGGRLVTLRVISPGSLAGFAMYSLIMAGNVSGVAGLYVDLMKAVSALNRLLEIMDRQPEIPPPSQLQGDMRETLDALPITKRPTTTKRALSVSFDSVFFAYPARPDVTVLQGFSLKVAAGQVVALVGSSGAGKTTVAALLTRLYNIQSGSITIDGSADYSPQQVRQSVGIVAQEPLLFPVSIADNIRYGKLDASHEEIVEAARLACVLEFANNMPLGLQTIVGPRGTQLSGGQKQRVAVARCLLKNPPILVLDEATSALDAESEHHVQKAIATACKGRTVFLIAHRVSSIRTADLIAVVKEGRVSEYGTFDDLISKRQGLFRQLVERQLVQ